METTTEEVKPKAPRAPRAKKATTKEKEPKAATEATEEVVAETAQETTAASKGSYIFGLGRRKTSIARVRLVKNGKGKIAVNGRTLQDYFGQPELQNMITTTLQTVGLEGAVDVLSDVEGGGIRGQAEATRLGLSRALIILNPTYRKTLKKMGALTRDPRAKERKKFGLKKARRAPQWSKR